MSDDPGLGGIVAEVLGPESTIGGRKVFSRRDLLVEVGPHFYGQPVERLHEVVDQLLASDAVVPLVAVTAAREQVYAPTEALAVEAAVAETIERITTQPVGGVEDELVAAAIAAKEADLGGRLTAGQADAVRALAAGSARVQFVVGVAGAGKTTALDAAAAALRSDGWRVLGTSTSGQAARTLHAETGVESSTVASLLWRLDHQQTWLNPRTVVVLDEAAMTTDNDLLRLVTAIDTASARLVLVGDPRQLGAVGPGGAMAALLDRHPDLVTTLDENVRQHDLHERFAIANLRNGHLHEALRWYARHDRIHHTPKYKNAIEQMVELWDADVAAGHRSTMLAWRRKDVDALNRHARLTAIAAGRVHGPSLRIDDTLQIAAGNQLIALAPNHELGIVTSQRLTVTAVDPDRQTATLDADGRSITVTTEHLAADPETGDARFGYGYATTIHRAQGATFDTCHLYANGGTHQLAYVALTRARASTTIHVVADDRDQALENLADDWARQDPQRWIIDDHPDPTHDDRHPRTASDKIRRARITAELDALRQFPDNGFSRRLEVESRIAEIEEDRTHLRNGTGRWANTPAGRAGRRLTAARAAHADAVRRAENSVLPRRERAEARREVDRLREPLRSALSAWQRHGAPHDQTLTHTIDELNDELQNLPTPMDRFQQQELLRHRVTHLQRQLEPHHAIDRGHALGR